MPETGTPGAAASSTVVVVTWRGAAHITACLDAVAAQLRAHRLLVVDNASDDGTAELLAAHPARPEVLRLDRNSGYAGALAAALPRVRTRYVGWLNDDAAPEPEWLALLEDALDADDGAGAASPRLLGPAGATQSVGVAITPIGYGADVTTAGPQEVFGFCGGAALVRAASLRALGGVPAEFFCYYEDTDTSWRLRLAGLHVLSVPKARVAHAHGASTGIGSMDFHRWNERNRLLMLLRCAPAAVAAREVLRFAVITALLPVRRAPDAPNFRMTLRLRVLAEVLRGTPPALRARRATGATAATRRTVWQTWAGR
ncbi:MAG: glycosyltransferase family 2 protein [Thermocrispum sp.]